MVKDNIVVTRVLFLRAPHDAAETLVLHWFAASTSAADGAVFAWLLCTGLLE